MQGKIKYLILTTSNQAEYSSFLLKVNHTEKVTSSLNAKPGNKFSFYLRLHFYD